MAIDYGTSGIGLAISDELGMTARPLATIRRGRRQLGEIYESIISLVAENEAGELVVGMPLNMDGSRGEAAERVDRFIEGLRRRLEIPVHEVDERLTSREADSLMRGMGLGEKERRARSDEFAAMIILRDYLERKSRLQPLE